MPRERAMEREAPGSTRRHQRPPVVVGYDGTAGALPALQWALEESLRSGAPLRVVRAWQWDDELAEPGLLRPATDLPELARVTLPEAVRDADDVTVVLAAGA